VSTDSSCSITEIEDPKAKAMETMNSATTPMTSPKAKAVETNAAPALASKSGEKKEPKQEEQEEEEEEEEEEGGRGGKGGGKELETETSVPERGDVPSSMPEVGMRIRASFVEKGETIWEYGTIQEVKERGSMGRRTSKLQVQYDDGDAGTVLFPISHTPPPPLATSKPQVQYDDSNAGTVRAFRQKFTLPRIPFGFTPLLLRLKLLHACGQWHSSRVSAPLTGCHCKLRPNTEGEADFPDDGLELLAEVFGDGTWHRFSSIEEVDRYILALNPRGTVRVFTMDSAVLG
jgi:hypothetical protein